MPADERWAVAAAALPNAGRAERELPFWRTVAATLSWRRVADAGCGSGFHLSLLRTLGVETVGFDTAFAVVRGVAGTVVGEVARPPVRAATCDAALCLGNTLSLLASRAEQERALAALAGLVRPGGTVLVQGEDVAALAADGPVVRARALPDGSTHVRVFRRKGRRIEMLAGVARPGAEAPLEETVMLPTSRVALLRLAGALGLAERALPCPPPGGPTTWWAALSAPSP